ncbi:IucA/IucC family protein [Streptomyces capillispiralis]|uniref:Siderophore synthetase component n=1 Tax=Streptomyces capillispiralis TaxID=68182 RepID=A0A561TAS1_9ACTN|nr:IucA/IucC family protein [Streptomyces capillispiralis]TWF84224.1 siderophore synthetase component [Streptomyces capillispiralis]GHH92878.1 iron transporter [Streptomyces capillispiralis]
MDLIPPPADDAASRADLAGRADAYAAVPLLNCLLREVARPLPAPHEAPYEAPHDGPHRTYHLPGVDRLLRVRGTRRPAAPEVFTGGAWHRVGHTELVKLVAEELRRNTGLSNHELPAEMADSRDAVAALLTARERATPPDDPYLRSEQSLLTGHTHHPAPKARGGGPVAAWLPYAPEAYARFPLALLGVRADTVAEEGDTAALDALGTAPPGYRLLPAHPWQLDLTARDLAPAFADGRLIRLGTTDFEVWPTAAVRTVYAPGPGLFLKFSLDVRITNDIRRLWRHDLRTLRGTDTAVSAAFAGMAESTGTTASDVPAAWLSDRGHRTAGFAFEHLAVVVRDGLRDHLRPGTTAYLAAALAEGFDGDPLAGTARPADWWRAYLARVVPPALTAFDRHGVVLEAHLQNTLIAVDSDGMPVQALFRDAEGVKLLADATRGTALPTVSREAGWERLVYCLLVNHLTEIAAALAERHPGLDPWPAVRRELSRHDLPEIPALLTAPTLPAKTNLLLRWTGADGADARYLPLPNPLAGG